MHRLRRLPRTAVNASAPATIDECQLLRVEQVLAILPVGKSTWWRGIQNGVYPKPVKLGPRMVAWRLSDIRALIKALEAA